jgi:hypothetical protein
MLKWNRKPTPIDTEIEKVHNELLLLAPGSDEYNQVLNHLKTLTELKNEKSSKSVSPDTWVMAAVSILGVLIIVAYEQKHIFSSKAMSMVSKPR